MELRPARERALRGNLDSQGEKLARQNKLDPVIGREREHMFQAPFGFYDRDYAGWQPMPKEADKK